MHFFVCVWAKAERGFLGGWRSDPDALVSNYHHQAQFIYPGHLITRCQTVSTTSLVELVY